VPVLVLHIDELNLNAVRAKLAPVGLQRRLDWLIDNITHAIQTLQDVLASSSTISRRWRIATALQPQDFVDALRAAFASH